MPKKEMFFIDGKNLVRRYQALKKEGKKPLKGIRHEPDAYVWHDAIIGNRTSDILRVNYYTSVEGDADKADRVKDELRAIPYHFQGDPFGGGGQGSQVQRPQFHGYICPIVFIKRNGEKSKGIDINMTIDMLNHAYNKDIEDIFLITGDGDFVPVIGEVKRRGIRVHVPALSSGLNPDIPRIADEFICIDECLFKAKEA